VKDTTTSIINSQWIIGNAYTIFSLIDLSVFLAKRNAFRWYQWDPTKWFIATCHWLGLASHLRVFPSNEIEKGALTMKLRALKGIQDSLKWPVSSDELPIVTWETCELPHSLLDAYQI